MVEIFFGAGTDQTEKHYSTILEAVPVVDNLIEIDTDFSTCTVQCIPNLKLLTDEIGADWYKNDWFTLYQNSVTGGSHTLHIVIDNTDIEITDNTYGNEYVGAVFYGYKLDAYKIWLEHGYVDFRCVMRNYDVNNNLVKEDWSVCMKLQKFSDQTANGTVVIESRKNGSLRNGKKYYDLRMTGGSKTLPWWDQRVRLPGKLKRSGFPIELSGVALNDGLQSRQQIFDTMGEEFDLTINLVSSEQIIPVIFDDLFANMVMVTDYNAYNFESYQRVRLVRESIAIQPRVVKRKSITFKMVNEQKKNEKFNDSL
jgi:hypothetical protein